MRTQLNHQLLQDPCLHVPGFSEDLVIKDVEMQGWLEKPYSGPGQDAIPAACHLFADIVPDQHLQCHPLSHSSHLMARVHLILSLFTELNVLPYKPAVPPALSTLMLPEGSFALCFSPFLTGFPII